MMTLDETIKHCIEVSKNYQNEQCGLEHRQLAKWLEELKKYREDNKKELERKMQHASGGLYHEQQMPW